jgi:hypothetical protein
MKMKLISTAIIGTVLTALISTSAQSGGIIDENTRDFAKYNCGELINDVADDVKKGHPQDQAMMMAVISSVMWADGYISHETGETKTTQQWLASAAGAIVSICPNARDKIILDIVRESAK